MNDSKTKQTTGKDEDSEKYERNTENKETNLKDEGRSINEVTRAWKWNSRHKKQMHSRER